MATDLSHLLGTDPISALVPTAQSGGGEPHFNRAHTAPGSAPSLEVVRMPDETDTHPAPEISADLYDTPVLIGEDGAKVTADENTGRPSPFTDDGDGTPWRSGRDTSAPLGGTVPRRVLRMGQWNNL